MKHKRQRRVQVYTIIAIGFVIAGIAGFMIAGCVEDNRKDGRATEKIPIEEIKTSETAYYIDPALEYPKETLAIQDDKRSNSAVKLKKGRLFLPSGEVIRVFSALTGAPPQAIDASDWQGLLDVLERTPAKAGDHLFNGEMNGALLQIDIESAPGETIVVHINFSTTDKAYVTATYDETWREWTVQGKPLLKKLRALSGYKSIKRSVLSDAISCVGENTQTGIKVALAPAEMNQLVNLINDADVYDYPKLGIILEHDVTFTFGLKNGTKIPVIYGGCCGGEFGIYADVYQMNSNKQLSEFEELFKKLGLGPTK